MEEEAQLPEVESILPWFAIQVRSKFEWRVSTMLKGTGYETFFPMYRDRRSWSDRIKEVEVPLFPGYTFCRFNPQRRLPILKTPGVMDIVSFEGRPAPIPDHQIASVRSVVETDLAVRPWPFLQVGQKVRINKGPLAGVEGFLMEFKQGFRLVVSITILNRSVSAELDGAWVTPDMSHSLPACVAL
jgi:transcription antitermination factor NusG